MARPVSPGTLSECQIEVGSHFVETSGSMTIAAVVIDVAGQSPHGTVPRRIEDSPEGKTPGSGKAAGSLARCLPHQAPRRAAKRTQGGGEASGGMLSVHGVMV
uniref:Uncharacterized protein n=1 Tax=Parascaris univalens TaxID=6257 RepID=A0A914ZTL4_PARUN